MFVFVTAEFAALKQLIAYELYLDQPDVPYEGRGGYLNPRLLRRIGYWVELMLLLNASCDRDLHQTTDLAEEASGDDAEDTQWDEVVEAHLNALGQEFYQQFTWCTDLNQIVSVTPLDAEGTALVMIQKPPSPKTYQGDLHVQNHGNRSGSALLI